MTITAHRPAPLYRSIPFWILVGGSAVSAGGGAFMLVDTLSGMSTVLLDGSATGVDVYVGQVWAILGAILIGAGAIGLGFALTLAVLRRLLTRDATTDQIVQTTDDFGYDQDLGYDDVEDDDLDESAVSSLDDAGRVTSDDERVTTR